MTARDTNQPLKIAVAGAGYVGLALAVLLARDHQVVCCDIDADRVARLQQGRSSVQDEQIQQWMTAGDLDLQFTTDAAQAYHHRDLVLVATPTDYDPASQYFDTRSVSAVIDQAAHYSPEATIVIKSTIPVGYTEEAAMRHPDCTILFSPEFLREGRALHDNLHPARIVVGGNNSAAAARFGELMRSQASTDAPILPMRSAEAEAVKLFANTYLAMRVAFFNELDSFAMAHRFDSKQLIDAICHDPRIGEGYNNPSFGYGGYCLPKDTKQLLANYSGIPQSLMSAIVESNERRMDWIAGDLVSMNPRTVGVYRLSMKAGSDNFRQSSILSVARALTRRGIEVVLFEPALTTSVYDDMEVLTDKKTFFERCEVIITNRRSPDLQPVQHKVYSRDLFGYN